MNTPDDAAPTDALPTQYDPAEVEVSTYQRWVDAGYFHADEQRVLSGERRPFSIVLPPPNVTGNLHVGHALDHTLMDILSRWHRMSGDEVLWLPGMDHAGIATQTLVEKQLAAEGTNRHEMGRTAFVQRVWDWKAQSGGSILGQMRRLGDSVDWSRERFTLDEGLSAAVHTIFKKLYDEGLIYRAKRITNWCPGCQTALSDIEVDHRDDDGELVSMRYDGEGFSVVVATTRVETMLGDTAIAVHPDDERYREVIGKTVTVPLVGRAIPIVADAHVDPEFGTGAVKVTPAHDPNDFDIAQRHQLPAIDVLTTDARITDTGTEFDGLDRFAARTAVKAALSAAGHVVSEKSPYTHAVGHCSRSDDVVEPRLSLQWFVRVAPLAAAAGNAVRDGRTRLSPPDLEARYFEWVDNMHDWTISRQLWWGHRIPVWYGPGGEMRCVGPDEEPPGDGWVQDDDVLDTWFSSALWPFSTMGWPEQTDSLRAFYPTSVLVTGYDILFFWVARMMMMGLYAMDGNENGSQPFDVVALHGLVRDEHGKKMSKSRGNVVDPLAWIDTYGADALRLTLARGANPGTDQAIAEDWVRGSKSFCSKLFNATRFALMNGARVPDEPVDGAAGSAADRWILGRLDTVVAETTELLTDFQFSKAAEGLYHFAWDEFCDWYVELAKPSLYSDGPEADHTRVVLGTVLDTLLRLLHPFVPFVTESLWTRLTGGETLVTAPWPVPSGRSADAGAASQIADTIKLVTEIRRFRSDQGLPPGRRVPARLNHSGGDIAEMLSAARALSRFTEPDTDFAPSAAVEVPLSFGTITVEVDTSETIDVAAEKARLDKDLVAARKEVEQATHKLNNPSFVEKAPEQVVDKIRTRHAAAEAEIDRLTARLAVLPNGSGAA